MPRKGDNTEQLAGKNGSLTVGHGTTKNQQKQHQEQKRTTTDQTRTFQDQTASRKIRHTNNYPSPSPLSQPFSFPLPLSK